MKKLVVAALLGLFVVTGVTACADQESAADKSSEVQAVMKKRLEIA
jgi:hypothetical protein